MLAINGEVRINIYNPLCLSNILPPPPPLQMSSPPLVRQNAFTPEQWAEIDKLLKQRKVFIPHPPVRVSVPCPSPAVIYEDSDDESTCTSEWDIEKGRF